MAPRDVTDRSTATFRAEVPARDHGRDWKMDPDLELWVDAEDDVLRVSVEGTLDDRTAPTLVKTIEQLVAEGHDEILMDARKLEIRGRDRAVFARVGRSLADLPVKVAWN
jgi:hypothetical protein